MKQMKKVLMLFGLVVLLQACTTENVGRAEVPDKKALRTAMFTKGGVSRYATVIMVQSESKVFAWLRHGRTSQSQINTSAASVCAHMGSTVRSIEPLRLSGLNTFVHYDTLVFHCK